MENPSPDENATFLLQHRSALGGKAKRADGRAKRGPKPAQLCDRVVGARKQQQNALASVFKGPVIEAGGRKLPCCLPVDTATKRRVLLDIEPKY